MFQPLIALTIGDPAGIGPEICWKAIAAPTLQGQCRFLLLGDNAHLNFVRKKVLPRTSIKNNFTVVDFKNVPGRTFRFAKATRTLGKASGEYIRNAVALALRGDVDALVTAPINKQSFRLGGWGKQYTGHTEMLAALTGQKNVALMLAAGSFRAVHVTSHLALKNVARALSSSRIFDTVVLTHAGLKSLGVKRPRVAVCALNPHAGDNGLMGSEEKRVIVPAIQHARRRGLRVDGPLPADALWPQVWNGTYDVGVAMYHDQGQIPVKLLGSLGPSRNFHPGGVNITLGLPIIRTSPAHGTAYDIAGRGVASEKSMVEAIQAAVQMARRSRHGH